MRADTRARTRTCEFELNTAKVPARVHAASPPRRASYRSVRASVATVPRPVMTVPPAFVAMDPELTPTAEPLPPALQALEEFKTRASFLSGAAGFDTSAYNARGEISLDEDCHWMDLPDTFGEYCDYEALEVTSDYDGNRDTYSVDGEAPRGAGALRSHPLQDLLAPAVAPRRCSWRLSRRTRGDAAAAAPRFDAGLRRTQRRRAGCSPCLAAR